MVLVILVVILEQLCVLVHCEGESLYEGVKARGAVLYLLPENLGQFVWTVETVCVTGLPFHQRISARWEQHLKKKSRTIAREDGDQARAEVVGQGGVYGLETSY